MTKMDYMEAVAESVTQEYNAFYSTQMQNTKETIFAQAHKIFAYTALKNFFQRGKVMDEIQYRCLFEDRGSILALLYDEYLSDEYATLVTDNDIVAFIKNVNQTIHKYILEAEPENE